MTGPVTHAERLPEVATFLALFVLGVVFGCWCAFLVPLRLPGGIEGLADVIALVGSTAAGLFGAWGTRRVAAAAMPGLGVLAAVAVASANGPGGDLVVPGGLNSDPGVGVVGELLLLAAVVGLVAAVVVAARRLR